MRITLGSNIASLTAQRRLDEASRDLSKSYERLSSGMRINRASDDAAGLALADSLSADSRISNQAIKNLNDGISLFTIAASAIENLTGLLVRMEELAEQSANGTYSSVQRAALDGEAQALWNEYTRITETTEFNGISLLNGSASNIDLQAGRGEQAVLSGGI